MYFYVKTHGGLAHLYEMPLHLILNETIPHQSCSYVISPTKQKWSDIVKSQWLQWCVKAFKSDVVNWVQDHTKSTISEFTGMQVSFYDLCIVLSFCS